MSSNNMTFNPNMLQSIGFKSLVSDILQKMRDPTSNSSSQPLKRADMSTHPDNAYFIRELTAICLRMQGNPAQQHYDKFLAFAMRDICDAGAIYNNQSYVTYCGARVGVPQFGCCNKRVWVEIMRGTEREWISLQKQWNTPVDYINIMEESMTKRGNLTSWFEYYPRIYGNKYQKIFNDENNNENNNEILSSSNPNKKSNGSRKRKLSEISNHSNRVIIAPIPEPLKKRHKSNINSNTPIINVYKSKPQKKK
eukprot:187865_1